MNSLPSEPPGKPTKSYQMHSPRLDPRRAQLLTSDCPRLLLEAGRSFRLFSYQPSYSPAPLPPGSFLSISKRYWRPLSSPLSLLVPFHQGMLLFLSSHQHDFLSYLKKKNHTIKQEYIFLVKAFQQIDKRKLLLTILQPPKLTD